MQGFVALETCSRASHPALFSVHDQGFINEQDVGLLLGDVLIPFFEVFFLLYSLDRFRAKSFNITVV